MHSDPLFCLVNIVQVLFSVLTIIQFVMCDKRVFFSVLKAIPLENTLPFRDCLYGSRTLSNAMHLQLTRKLGLHGLVEMH